VSGAPKPIVYVIDGDAAVRDSIRLLLECEGFTVHSYASGSGFLREDRLDRTSCIVVDENLPGLNGLDLLEELLHRGIVIPAILTTSRRDTDCLRSTVARAGATPIKKPYEPRALLANVWRFWTAAEPLAGAHTASPPRFIVRVRTYRRGSSSVANMLQP
jgi:two-component system response regulator FixJ